MRSCGTRGVIVRPVGGYGLPHCLRITVGPPRRCGIVIDACDGVHAPVAEPLFRRLALIGIGLIGTRSRASRASAATWRPRWW